MELLYNPYLEITAFVFLLMLTFFFSYKERLYTLTSIIYNIFLFVALIGLGLDIVGTYTLTFSQSLPLSVNVIINSALFIFLSTIPLMFMLLTMAMTGRLPRHNFKIDKLKLVFLLVPYIGTFLVILVNVSSHWIFYFDSNLRYLHGSGFNLLFLEAAFYMICGVYVVFRYKSRISFVQFLTIIFYVAILSLSMILQHFFPYYLITPAAVAFALLSMYFTFQNPDYYIDKMTGLYGRAALLVVSQQLIDRNDIDKMVIFIDINNFKRINNLFGMRCGDRLIYDVSNYLTKISPDKRSLFRVDGDSFILLINSEASDQAISRIQSRFAKRWPVLDTNLFVSVNICKMPLCQYATNSEELMMYLTNAMGMAKRRGDNVLIDIDGDIVSDIERKLRIENILSNLEYNKCLSLYWQPIYNVHKQRFTSVEVLLRMYDKELGFVPADEFIEVSEHKGLICSIGHYVLQQTCQFISENSLDQFGIEKIDINLSLAECMQEGLVENICDMLTRYPISPLKLNFEITETTAAMSVQIVQAIMEKLIAAGMEFSLDDYGRGYSNNDVIIKLPFKFIKIDKTLLWDTLNNDKAKVVLSNSVRMLKEMDLQIVAEGAETQEQIDYLLATGVDYIQGYYFSRAVSGDELIELLQDQE